MRETELVRACVEILLLHGVFAWRQNTGAFSPKDRHGKTRWVRFGKRGTSDILGVLPDGRFLAVECKRGKAKATTEQQDFLDAVRRRGGVGLVVYRVDELLAELTKLGLREK